MTEEIIEAQAVETTEVVPAPTTGTLFRTDDPAKVIQRATDVANALKPVLVERNMVVQIKRKEHVTIEGWMTLGAMLGVTCLVEWTRPLEDGWEARAVAQTLDGRVIGAAEAECLRAESRWKSADDYAVRSMAQTRAQSKALASVLRFVVTLAGYSGTPAEEMPRGNGNASHEATPPQKRAITTILNKAGMAREFQRAVVLGVGGDPLTKAGASKILDLLNRDGHSLENNVDELVAQSDAVAPSDVPGDDSDLPDASEAEAASTAPIQG